MGDKTEETWIGKLAVIPNNGNKSNAVIFDIANKEVANYGWSRYLQ